MAELDLQTFRRHIQTACQRALDQLNSRQLDKEAALARIDGIFDGAFAAAKGLKQDLWAGEMMEVAREETGKAQREILTQGDQLCLT